MDSSYAYLSGELLLPSVQHFCSLLRVPSNVVYFIVIVPVVVHFSFAHELDNGLQSFCGFQVLGPVARSTANYQLFGPVHILCGETVATAG